MIKKIEDLNFYELLEISPSATAQEIHKAYERIRRVYEPNSVALYSLFSPEETSAIHQRIEEGYRTLMYEDNRRKYDAMLRARHELPETHAPEPEPLQPTTPKFQPRPVAPQPQFTAPPQFPVSPETHYRDLAEIPETRPQVVSHRDMPSPVSQLIAEFTGAAIRLLREQKGLTIRNVADMTKVNARYLELIEEEGFQKLPARAYIRGFLTLYAKALGCNPDKVAIDYLKRYDAATGFPYSLRRKPEDRS